MNAIRIRRLIDSDTLHLPEIKPLIGRTVEIIILEEVAAPNGAVAGNRFLALAPSEEPFDPREVETLRADPKFKRFWPLLELAGQDVIDAEAIAQLRAASML